MTKATITFFDEPDGKSVSVLVHELAHHTQQVLRGQDAHGAGHNKHFRLVAEALIGIERGDDRFSLNDWWREHGRKGIKAEEEGHWVTTRQGNRLFISDDGVARTGPGGEAIDSDKENSGDGRTMKRMVDEQDISKHFTEQGQRIKDLVVDKGLQDTVSKYTVEKRIDSVPYHAVLNKSLRTAANRRDLFNLELAKLASDLDVLTSNEFDEPVTVFRGVGAKLAYNPSTSVQDRGVAFLAKAEEMLSEGGGTIEDYGFASTSASPNVASEFGGWIPAEKSKLVMQIEGVRKGAYLESVTDYGNEFEVLLPRNSRFEILGIDKNVKLEDRTTMHIVVRVKAVYDD